MNAEAQGRNPGLRAFPVRASTALYLGAIKAFYITGLTGEYIFFCFASFCSFFFAISAGLRSWATSASQSGALGERQIEIYP